ncbi:hypothetical protein Q5M85_01920 [Paraclostridium bifermentans]|nr:hypothetical protein [Paraclostridium bifermentans]
MIAIDLAKYMKEKFGIDYIYFDKHMSKNIIFENYHKLSKILDIDFNKQLSEQRKEYDELFLKVELKY